MPSLISSLVCLLISAICLTGCESEFKHTKAEWPCFSPDGKSVVFSHMCELESHDGWWTLFKVNVDGTGLTQLMSPKLQDPCKHDWGEALFSPDGKQIMYAETGIDRYSVMVITLAGNSRQIMDLDERYVQNAGWLRDSKGIILVDDTPIPPGFRVMTLEGTPKILSLQDRLSRYRGSGFWIVYKAITRNPKSDTLQCAIWKKRIDNSNSKPIRLTDGKFYDDHPRLASDGKRVVFSSKRRPCGIWAVDIDGKNLKCIHTDEAADYPTWSPDGRKIAFIRDAGGARRSKSDVWIMDSDGRNLRRVTNMHAYESGRMSPVDRLMLSYLGLALAAIILVIAGLVAVVRGIRWVLRRCRIGIRKGCDFDGTV